MHISQTNGHGQQKDEHMRWRDRLQGFGSRSWGCGLSGVPWLGSPGLGCARSELWGIERSSGRGARGSPGLADLGSLEADSLGASREDTPGLRLGIEGRRQRGSHARPRFPVRLPAALRTRPRSPHTRAPALRRCEAGRAGASRFQRVSASSQSVLRSRGPARQWAVTNAERAGRRVQPSCQSRAESCGKSPPSAPNPRW